MQQWTAEEHQRLESFVRDRKHWNGIVVELDYYSLEECKGHSERLDRPGGVQGLEVAHIEGRNAKSETVQPSPMGEESQSILNHVRAT